MSAPSKQKLSLTKLAVSSSSSSHSDNPKQDEGESSDDAVGDTKIATSQATTLAKTISAEAIKTISPVREEGDDSYSVMLPSSWLATGLPPPGDCNILVQVDPDDAARLEYEGSSGAIGRFEAGPNGIVLDLKGHQYQASLLPGPTALLVGLNKGSQLRIEGMTDEFASLVQTSDVMAKLDAIVTGAELDEGYNYVEENVNRVDKIKGQDELEEGKVPNRKRASSKPPTKRRKKSLS